MFDTNKDGVVNVEDFKGMSAKAYGMAIGLVALIGAIVYFLS